jgi:hypothetical protein
MRTFRQYLITFLRFPYVFRVFLPPFDVLLELTVNDIS